MYIIGAEGIAGGQPDIVYEVADCGVKETEIKVGKGTFSSLISPKSNPCVQRIQNYEQVQAREDPVPAKLRNQRLSKRSFNENHAFPARRATALSRLFETCLVPR